MQIDLTYTLTKRRLETLLESSGEKSLVSVGHFGTHFDVMGQTFPLEYTESRGVLFDASSIDGNEIGVDDVDLSRIRAEDFVLIRTATIERFVYGSTEYLSDETVLSWELIDQLVERRIRMIGVDMSGIRRGNEHPKADQFCAGRGVFVVENLVNLDKLQSATNGGEFIVHTYPWNVRGFSGLPSRVIASY